MYDWPIEYACSKISLILVFIVGKVVEAADNVVVITIGRLRLDCCLQL